MHENTKHKGTPHGPSCMGMIPDKNYLISHKCDDKHLGDGLYVSPENSLFDHRVIQKYKMKGSYEEIKPLHLQILKDDY